VVMEMWRGQRRFEVSAKWCAKLHAVGDPLCFATGMAMASAAGREADELLRRFLVTLALEATSDGTCALNRNKLSLLVLRCQDSEKQAYIVARVVSRPKLCQGDNPLCNVKWLRLN
jgi:hypothetical protein